LLGWSKVVFFGLFDLSRWSRQAADIAFVVVVVVLAGVALFGLWRWLQNRLREPRPLHHIGLDLALFVPLLGGPVAAFMWMDYHVKGLSPLFGVNPRCVEYVAGYCFKLDTTNLPWDARTALWLDEWQFVIFLSVACVGWSVLLLWDRFHGRRAR
jgi:hypothetical protein